MKVVIQRVLEAAVTVEGAVCGAIGNGLLILVGFQSDDSDEDIEWGCKKIANLRIFNDENGVMNRSLVDINGEALLVSQFTLFASTKKGNRPSYSFAAPPEIAIPLYNRLKINLQKWLQKPLQCGIFAADMKVSLINDGPVTIIIDTKNRV